MSHVRTIIIGKVQQIKNEFPETETAGDALVEKVNEADDYAHNGVDVEKVDALTAKCATIESGVSAIHSNLSNYTAELVNDQYESWTADLTEILE